jgi:phage gpG-like protein
MAKRPLDPDRHHYRKGTQASKPGEYPRHISGHLQRNVAMEFAPELLVARVGTNVPYGKWLELGTRNMAPRPWLTLGLQECMADMQACLQGFGEVGEIQTSED